MNELKSKFLKIYANLPLSLRSEIVLVIDDEPLTWNACFIEIENGTEKSKLILEKLKKLKIIE
jgi:hypothetical protein